MGAKRTVQQKKDGDGGRTDRFARLSLAHLLERPSYRALSPTARALLVEFGMMYKPRNRGELWLSVRDAADRLGLSDLKAARAALDELRDGGFIVMLADAHFAMKSADGSRARVWRVTWEPYFGKRQQPATQDYYDRQPLPGTKAHKRMEQGLKALKRYKREEEDRIEKKITVVDSSTPLANRVGVSSTTVDEPPAPILSPVVETSTRKEANGGKPQNLVVEDSSTHTAKPATGTKNGSNPGDCRPEKSGGPAPIQIEPNPLEALREQVRVRWSSLNARGRAALASRVNLTTDEVSRFVAGRFVPAIQKQAALRAAARGGTATRQEAA